MAVKLVAAIMLLSSVPCAAQAPSRAELGKKALQLVAADVKSPDPEVRAQAAAVLGSAGNASAVPMLKVMLRDKDKYVRIAAARALWELGSPAGVRTLYALINDIPAQGPVPVTNTPLVELKIISQNKIREKAMEALTEMKGKDAADVLFKLKNDNYGTVRDAASRELASIGYDEELPQFTDALASGDEGIRYEAVTALAKICSPSSAGPLRELLASEKSVRVRMGALDALKCSPAAKDALDDLLKLADDENPTIKYKAVAVLARIRDGRAKAKLAALAAATSDIRLRITAQKGLILNGELPDLAVIRSALSAASPDIKLEALDAAAALTDDDARPLLSAALDDPSGQVKLAAALQVLKRFSKK